MIKSPKYQSKLPPPPKKKKKKQKPNPKRFNQVRTVLLSIETYESVSSQYYISRGRERA